MPIDSEKLDKLKRTFEYARDHTWASRTRDFFYLLESKGFDPTLYQILANLRDFIDLKTLTFTIDVQSDKSPELQIVEQLNAYYIQAIQNATNSANLPSDKKATKEAKTQLRHIKKLRHAYYELALAHNLPLNDLIYASGNAIQDLKDQRHKIRSQKAAVEINTALNLDGKNKYFKNKYLKFIFSKVTPNRPEQALESAEEAQAFCDNLVNGITDADDLTIADLLEIKRNLQKFYLSFKLNEDFSVIDKKIRALRASSDDYKHVYSKVRNVLTALNDSKVTTSLRNKTIGLSKDMDSDMFKIFEQLANMEFPDYVNQLIKRFFVDNPQAEIADAAQARKQLKKFLDLLYATFNALSIQEDIRVEDLKKLKKLINHFAEKNDFNKKLFNLRKAYHKQIAEDEIAEKLRNTPQRVFAYMEKSKNIVDAKKQKNRFIKKILNGISLFVSITVAIGEGIMAAVFFGYSLIASLGSVGTSGFATNYFLFRRDSYDTLKQLFVTGLFKDSKGMRISGVKRAAIYATIAFSIGISAVFATFTINTALIGITGLLALGSIACPPLVIALAIFLATVAFVANATMFYCMMADFIKNDRIIQVAAYFKRTFKDVWNEPKEWEFAADGKVTGYMKFCHYGQAAAKFLLSGLFLIVGFTACAFMTAITFGLGHTQGLLVLDKVTSAAPILAKFIDAKAKDLIATIVVAALAGPINSYFYWRGMMKVIEAVKTAVVATVSAIFHPIETGRAIVNGIIAMKKNPLRTVNVVISSFKSVVLTGMAVVNGAGQGGGPYHDPGSNSSVQTMFNGIAWVFEKCRLHAIAEKIREWAAGHSKDVAGADAAVGSMGVNSLAIWRALQLSEASYYALLDPRVQDLIAQGALTKEHAQVLVHIHDPDKQLAVANVAVSDALTPDQMRARAKSVLPVRYFNQETGESEPLLDDLASHSRLKHAQAFSFFGALKDKHQSAADSLEPDVESALKL